MATQRCPSCGEELPAELGQHALTPTSGLVQCPGCGETVTLERPETSEAAAGENEDLVPDTAGDPETFSGEETLEGVMEELEEKPGGPEGER